MKHLFPKPTSIAIAASLCFLSLGQAQENDTQRQDRTAGHTADARHSEMTGKIMPLKAFLATQTGGVLDKDEKEEQYDKGGIQPLVLVVDSRPTAGQTGRTTDPTDPTTGTTTLTTERAYILVFQDDEVKDKAEQVCKDQLERKQEKKDDENATAHRDYQQKHVKVSGESTSHGGVMAILVREVDEDVEPKTRTETQPQSKTETKTESEGDTKIEIIVDEEGTPVDGKKVDENDDN